MPVVATVLTSLALGCGPSLSRVIELSPAEVALVTVDAGLSGFDDATPLYRNSQRRGLQLRRVRPGTVVALMDLREGDVLRELVGIACDDLLGCRAGAAAMESALRRGEPFDLIVERSGELWRFTYRPATFAPLE